MSRSTVASHVEHTMIIRCTFCRNQLYSYRWRVRLGNFCSLFCLEAFAQRKESQRNVMTCRAVDGKTA